MKYWIHRRARTKVSIFSSMIFGKKISDRCTWRLRCTRRIILSGELSSTGSLEIGYSFRPSQVSSPAASLHQMVLKHPLGDTPCPKLPPVGSGRMLGKTKCSLKLFRSAAPLFPTLVFENPRRAGATALNWDRAGDEVRPVRLQQHLENDALRSDPPPLKLRRTRR